jgi:preprotein translocase subunit SecY
MAGIVGLVRLPELRKRLLFVLGMLVVYRIGVHVPTPGIDGEALAQVFSSMQGTIFGWFNLFSGGALERFSIFALGIMPYISSSIIFQLLTVVWPHLAELQKEGEQGRRKITQYTRYGTIVLAMVQGYGIATGLEQYNNPQVVIEGGLAFRLMTMLTLASGTVFLMWLGEQMSERGIGNGTSMLIYAGIASGVLGGATQAFKLYQSNEITFLKLLIVGAIIVGTLFVIIFVERGVRALPVVYAKRIVGRKVYGGQNTSLPLKVNTSGVIPPIFASSLIMFPATIGTFFPSEWMQKVTAQIQPGTLLYDVLFVGLIIFFSYFYTAVTFKTDDVAEGLKKNGGFIPNKRPGEETASYIEYVLSRITLGGAVYMSLICILPTLMTQTFKVPFYFGGTSVLILVGVALDTVAQIETFLISHNYEGFSKHGRVRGRAAYQ